MITSMEIHGFKKFDELKMEGFSRINLFVGTNNVGKTTVLEAILAFCCGKSLLPFFHMSILHRQNRTMGSGMLASSYGLADMILQSFTRRNNPEGLEFYFQGEVDREPHRIQHVFTPGEIFEEFFPQYMGGLSRPEPSVIEMQNIQMQSGKGVSIQISRQALGTWAVNVDGDGVSYPIAAPDITEENHQRPFLLARFNDVLSHRDERGSRRIYSQLSRENRIHDFVRELNQSFHDMKIQNIENIPYPDGSEAFISMQMRGGDRIPLYAMGDGVRRWYDVLGGMLFFRNAVHCLEEIDSGFHYEAQEQLSRNLIHYAVKYHNQLFMTTHNIEYVDALLRAAKQQGAGCLPDSIRIITLRHDDKGIAHRVMDGEEALWARERGLELRR